MKKTNTIKNQINTLGWLFSLNSIKYPGQNTFEKDNIENGKVGDSFPAVWTVKMTVSANS